MENISENTEATAINTVAEKAVEKIEATVAPVVDAADNNNAVVINENETLETEIDATIETSSTVPVLQTEDNCESIICNPTVRIGAIIGVAVIILIVLSLIIKSKKKKTANKGKKKSYKSNPNAVEIYVGNLSYEMGNSELRKEFEKFGIVTSARIITQRNSRKSKGYGFVEMPHRSEAEEAIRALNNKEIKGRKIHVNEARANTRHGNH